MNTIEEVEVEYELPSGVVLYATVSIPFHNNDPVPDEMTLEYCEINSNGKSIAFPVDDLFIEVTQNKNYKRIEYEIIDKAWYKWESENW